jgi:hypothetical protein
VDAYQFPLNFIYGMRLIEKIAGNFLLRNVFVFLTLHSPSFLQRLALKKDSTALIDAVCLYVLFYLLCMFHNIALYKHFLAQKKYFSYVVFLLLSITIFQGLLVIEEHYVGGRPFPPHTAIVWATIYGIDLSYMLLGFGMYYAFHHFKNKHDLLKLQYLHRELELKQLKEQLNPHFLFNALNNIYSYSLEKNSYSKELILKLSELMRFILTNSDRDKIPLQEECAFIESYMAFEKERLGDLCEINYQKNITNENKEIAPFILFTLVENAFKHGTHSTERSSVGIQLSADERMIRLTTTNLITEPTTAVSTKVGLSNIKRRLELLYPQSHTLKTNADKMAFNANLTLMTIENGN